MAEENISEEELREDIGDDWGSKPKKPPLLLRMGIALGKNWHLYLMGLGVTFIFLWLAGKLENVDWGTDPEFYIGLFMLAMGFVGYYFKQK